MITQPITEKNKREGIQIWKSISPEEHHNTPVLISQSTKDVLKLTTIWQLRNNWRISGFQKAKGQILLLTCRIIVGPVLNGTGLALSCKEIDQGAMKTTDFAQSVGHFLQEDAITTEMFTEIQQSFKALVKNSPFSGDICKIAPKKTITNRWKLSPSVNWWSSLEWNYFALPQLYQKFLKISG